MGEHLATKQDIAELKTDIATQFQAVYRHLWIMGAGLVAVNAAMLTAAVALTRLLPPLSRAQGAAGLVPPLPFLLSPGFPRASLFRRSATAKRDTVL